MHTLPIKIIFPRWFKMFALRPELIVTSVDVSDDEDSEKRKDSRRRCQGTSREKTKAWSRLRASESQRPTS